ncbi:MAG: protein kinase [Vicinamibacterales bacterium]|nr:protein kinase [Vicinamibacterales bacterium]
MSLAPGTSLGHYDVAALIGEGGMGQAWQATDAQLNRQVALKILPDAFADDPDRLARFQREAQVLASLNHPNIAQIHGIEEAGETRALVLELVDGPTLADRIAKGAIPLHEAGVLPRNLKAARCSTSGVRRGVKRPLLAFGKRSKRPRAGQGACS